MRPNRGIVLYLLWLLTLLAVLDIIVGKAKRKYQKLNLQGLTNITHSYLMHI